MIGISGTLCIPNVVKLSNWMWWRSQLFGFSVILVSWRWKKLKLQIMLRTLRISDKDNYYGVTRWRLLDSTWPNLCERCILDFSADVTGIVSANWSISGGLYRWCGNKDCPLSFSTYSVIQLPCGTAPPCHIYQTVQLPTSHSPQRTLQGYLLAMGLQVELKKYYGP